MEPRAVVVAGATAPEAEAGDSPVVDLAAPVPAPVARVLAPAPEAAARDARARALTLVVG